MVESGMAVFTGEQALTSCEDVRPVFSMIGATAMHAFTNEAQMSCQAAHFEAVSSCHGG
jgi:hypothetical protein